MGEYITFQNKKDLSRFLLDKIKVEPASIRYFTVKDRIHFLFFEQTANQLCNIIKQDMISAGGDAAVSREVGRFIKGKSNLLLMGTEKQLNIFVEKSCSQPPTIKKIGQNVQTLLNSLNAGDLKFKIKNRTYNCKNKIYIMGIMNITPDSFYDGNKYNNYRDALSGIREMIKQGADIIDIGGESTRPGSEKITAKEEIKRVLPLVKFIKKNYKVPVSIDTYKSEVARAVLSEGADMINDISGLRFDPKTAGVIAKHKASVVLMHIKETPKTMQKNPQYSNLICEIKDYLSGSIKIALDNSIKFNNIIIDPGIGFGKSAEHNYIILKRLNELKALSRPILIGLSRKSLIGKVLNNEAKSRLNGTIALNTLSIVNGASIIRVHDIREHKEVKKLLEFYYKA